MTALVRLGIEHCIHPYWTLSYRKDTDMETTEGMVPVKERPELEQKAFTFGSWKKYVGIKNSRDPKYCTACGIYT